jgi:hypothetical protein
MSRLLILKFHWVRRGDTWQQPMATGGDTVARTCWRCDDTWQRRGRGGDAATKGGDMAWGLFKKGITTPSLHLQARGGGGSEMVAKPPQVAVYRELGTIQKKKEKKKEKKTPSSRMWARGGHTLRSKTTPSCVCKRGVGDDVTAGCRVREGSSQWW